MSRPRSRSPHYRRFPWEEPDFDPRKVLEEHDESPRDQSQRFRRGPEEPRDSFRDDMSSGGQRIPSLFPDDPHFRRQRHSDHDFYHGSLSPHRDGYESWSPTPQDNGGFDEDRRRGGFREDFQSFENREAFPWRDRLSPTQREAGVSWRRPERGRGRGRGQGRFEDFSSSVRSGDLRAEDMERGRRNTQGPFKGRQRENPHQDRGPVVKRPRGEMDDVKHFGPLCYSSDRQLSFDLVNVGRQRLDFLPMLEHSGTYRETEMHTGAFTQEIITLVHYVKDQYFGGDGVTLNQRFSAPQRGGEEELTLSQRFSSSRGFSLNSDSLLDDEDEEPLFSRLDSLQNKQPSRGPGDLRHDLERRRQEKLEAVKVTIPGSGSSQRSHGAVSEPDLMAPEHEGFWTGEQNRRRDGNMGPRRGASNRQNPGPQRWNHRYGHQRQNSHPAGPGW
ncbi:uncharacterized protein zgc:112982 isoform X2 [Kryptolebias marmoratus]|uniref:BCLAF1 and THRAP3 family member 3-like n=1 Tax=Kryptolebias marmoratus TaxID=37003 RepID=A0A3Q3AHS6_KRYMA|nr:uncharacterized protein zgc:112982 isoform X2 [Kryptolebias marmoratus]